MTPQELDKAIEELSELEKKVSPGHWVIDDGWGGFPIIRGSAFGEGNKLQERKSIPASAYDAEFILKSRNLLPHLLKVFKEQKAEIARLNGQGESFERALNEIAYLRGELDELKEKHFKLSLECLELHTQCVEKEKTIKRMKTSLSNILRWETIEFKAKTYDPNEWKTVHDLIEDEARQCLEELKQLNEPQKGE